MKRTAERKEVLSIHCASRKPAIVRLDMYARNSSKLGEFLELNLEDLWRRETFDNKQDLSKESE